MAKSKRTKAHTRYRLEDGTLVPGVTTVLGLLSKPTLVPWANKLGLAGIDVKLYVDDLADIGTLGHLMVTDTLQGKETDTSDFTPNQVDTATNCALSFWEWEKNHKIEEALIIETPLVSEAHRYGGTMDIYCVIGGKYWLIDLKTGKGIYEEAGYQVATLKMLLEEHGHEVDEVRVLNIPRSEDESFIEKVVTEHDLRVGWEIFFHLLEVYYLRKGSKNGRK